jgi:D-alanyl-D-alanine carboxypeptidase/D-alanyl-D-alanine-endopeptidase (penicillin-binding protein 4)
MVKLTQRLLFSVMLALTISSCSIQKQIAKEAKKDILVNADFTAAHVGISLFDPASGQYLYNHQGDKYFVPASNTKLLTCYVAMKNLGDSLVGIRYVDKGNGTIEVEGNGDASFLMADFHNQPVYDFLKQQKRILLTDANWKENALGAGWAWDDYNSDYMAERSAMPIYGNLAKFSMVNSRLTAIPRYFQEGLQNKTGPQKDQFRIRRDIGTNTFTTTAAASKFNSAEIPFYTGGNKALIRLLKDTLKTDIEQVHFTIERWPDVIKVYSQPTDSLLKIMMHRSDNFFAEQTLLMISNEKLAYMNDAKIIDTLLKTDLKNLPQKPKWVDGSGLSRYNLVTPQDFIWILAQMKKEFKWERIKTILPTGGEGTLSGLYQHHKEQIYAKTGSLSNHIALSGYITTKKGKQLIFSILVNAHMSTASNIRKAIEKFLSAVMDKY